MNIFYYDNRSLYVKNNILFLKCSYVNDVLLYNNLIKMICVIK